MTTISDKYIQRSLRVNRVSTGEGIKAGKLLDKAHDKIRKIINVGITEEVNSAALRKVEAEIAAVLKNFYSGEYLERVTRDARKIVQLETNWTFGTLNDFTLDSVLINGVDWNKSAIKAWKTPYQGKTFDKWYRQEGAKQTSKINKTLRGAFVNGMSIPETNRLVEGIMGKGNNNIKTLTRSAMMHNSAEARREMHEANKNIMDGYIWVSVLDLRTTVHICGVRDSLRYTVNFIPIDHDIPWLSGPGNIHFNCRSMEVPMIDDLKITGNRPAIGAGDKYKRGDNLTNRGTVRKPTKRNRDNGIYEIEKVTTRTKYEGWLRRQPTDFVADAFGSLGKAQAFKKGESLLKIVSDPLGKPLTLKQL